MPTTLATALIEARPDFSKAGQQMRKGTEQAATEAGTNAGEKFRTAAEGSIKKLALGVAGLLGTAGIGIATALTGALDAGAIRGRLQATLGATPQMAAEFGKIAGQLYAQNYGSSASDVADALRAIWQNGLVDEDAATADIQKVAAQAITTADVIGADYGELTQAVSQMLRTGMAGSATEAFDLIVRAEQQGINKSGDLLDTLNEYPTQFRKLGVDGPQAIGLMNQAIQAGARDSDIAADAIKEFSIRAVDGSKLSAQGFQALGLDARHMAEEIGAGGSRANAALDLTLDRLRAIPDPVQRSQAAVALFGTQAEDLGDALFAMDPSNAVAGLGDVAGAADRAGQAFSDNAQAKLQSFGRSMQQHLVDFVGGQVIPRGEEFIRLVRDRFSEAFGHSEGASKNLGSALSGLRDGLGGLVGFITDTVIPTIGRIIGWMAEHERITKAVAIAVGALLAITKIHAAFLAVEGAGGLVKYIAQMNIVQTATKIWTALQWLLNIALSANPIGLVVLAIGLLVGAVLLAWNKSEGFRNVVLGVWSALRKGIGDVWDWLVGVFHNMVRWITETLPNGFRSFAEGVRDWWNKIRNWVREPITAVVNTVINPLMSGFSRIAGFFGIKNVPSGIPGFREGGPITGPGTGTSDSILAQVGRRGPLLRVSNGEFIVPAKKVREYGVAFWDWISGRRSDARYPGDGSAGLRFAGGGLIGFFSDVIGDVTKLFTDPAKVIMGPINAALAHIPGGGTFRDLVVAMGKKLGEGVMSWVGGGGGNGDVGGAQAFIRSQVGKPYIWASAGPTGYDCSGIVSAVWNFLHHKNPYQHTFSTMNEAPYFPKPGPGVFTAGWTNPGESGVGGGAGGVGHTAGNLAGLAFESVGGSGVRIGPSVTALSRFAHIGHYRDGGPVGDLFSRFSVADTGRLTLDPGLNLVGNGTGAAEHMTATDDLAELLAELIEVTRSLPGGLGREIRGTSRGLLREARAT